jgi:hypothetical protein
MTGKPSQQSRSIATQTAASGASRPAGRPQPSKLASSAPDREKPVLDDDDPFDMESSVVSQKAIPAARQRVQGRSYRVVCPMCDTVGYVPQKAVGKEVRCANPDCLVPTFTAPEIKRPQPFEEEPKKGFPSPMQTFVGVATILIAACSFGAWKFVFKEDDSQTQQVRSHPINQTPVKQVNPKSADLLQETVAEQVEIEEPAINLREIQPQILKLMVKTSQRRTINQRKPFCRRLTSEAYALTGDLDGARKQLERLAIVGSEVPFYGVLPLVAIAFKELEAGQKDAARKTLDKARIAAQSLPHFGRLQLHSTTALASALIAAGHPDRARLLINDHRDSGSLGQLSILLQAVREDQTFDLDAAVAFEPLIPWTLPISVAVTRTLAVHGYWDEALSWAEAANGAEQQNDCLVAWAEALTKHSLENKQPEKLNRLEAIAQNISPAGRARMYACVAGRLIAGGDSPQAEQFLTRARDALGSIAVPQAIIVPEMTELFTLELPDPVELRSAALAAAEVARVEDQLNQPQAAWKSLLLAIRFPRAMAPSPPAIQSRLDEIETLGPGVFRERLKRAFALGSYDEADRKLRDYRQRCRSIRQAAEERFQQQTTLLAKAAAWNLRDEIWNEIRTRSDEPDPDQREPYYGTAVPWILAYKSREAGHADKADAIETSLARARQNPDPQVQLKETTTRLIAAGDVEQAAVKIQKSRVDEAWRTQWSMQLACRLVKSGRTRRAFDFVRAFKSQLLRESTLELIAALATRQGDGAIVWNRIQEVPFPPTEKVAVCRGFVAGIVAIGQNEGP